MLALLVGFRNALAADVSLSWQPSASTNVTGYNIYYGTSSGNYTGKITVGNVTTTTISNLNCGAIYFFPATALDSSGNESGFSNETRFLVPGLLTLNAGENPTVPAASVPSSAITSPASAKAKPSTSLTINFPVAPGHWYEVQATVDFISWTTIWQTGLAASNAWVQYSDPDASTYSSRYYRLVLH